MNNPSSWKPTTSIQTLKTRAILYKKIRKFFEDKNVLEVETPILGFSATVDPHIDSLVTEVLGETRYLQTSPEFFLKRLLAADTGDIYSLGKVFRQGERGARHHPEFTMLEWYRVGWNEHQLMREVSELVKKFFGDVPETCYSYQAVFEKSLGINPHAIDTHTLKKIAQEKLKGKDTVNSMDKDGLLDLLMTHFIEPGLPDGLVFINNYPASKVALAKLDLDEQGQNIARRFELYINGVELANGYFELTDAEEQQRRFETDLAYREKKGLPKLPYDQALVSAMVSGLPACAGVALGVDRLLMLMMSENELQKVISFSEQR